MNGRQQSNRSPKHPSVDFLWGGNPDGPVRDLQGDILSGDQKTNEGCGDYDSDTTQPYGSDTDVEELRNNRGFESDPDPASDSEPYSPTTGPCLTPPYSPEEPKAPKEHGPGGALPGRVSDYVGGGVHVLYTSRNRPNPKSDPKLLKTYFCQHCKAHFAWDPAKDSGFIRDEHPPGDGIDQWYCAPCFDAMTPEEAHVLIDQWARNFHNQVVGLSLPFNLDNDRHKTAKVLALFSKSFAPAPLLLARRNTRLKELHPPGTLSPAPKRANELKLQELKELEDLRTTETLPDSPPQPRTPTTAEEEAMNGNHKISAKILGFLKSTLKQVVYPSRQHKRLLLQQIKDMDTEPDKEEFWTKDRVGSYLNNLRRRMGLAKKHPERNIKAEHRAYKSGGARKNIYVL